MRNSNTNLSHFLLFDSFGHHWLSLYVKEQLVHSATNHSFFVLRKKECHSSFERHEFFFFFFWVDYPFNRSCASQYSPEGGDIMLLPLFFLSKVSFSHPRAMTAHAEKSAHSFCHLGHLPLPHPLHLCWGQCCDSVSWHFWPIVPCETSFWLQLRRFVWHPSSFLHLHCKTKVQLLSKEK